MKNLFLFITANEHEKAAFKLRFKSEKNDSIKGKSYEIGKFGLYDVAYIHIDVQGYTNPAALPLVGELVREINPIAVVMVGIAFGADEKKQNIGDVLVSQKILSYDAEKIKRNEKTKEDFNVYKEDAKEPGFQLLNAFGNSDDWAYLIDGRKAAVHKGAILTGSKLISNKDFKKKLMDDFKTHEPIGGEMEAYGVYSVCRLHGVSEWIIVKAICDWAYNKDKKKEEYQKIASASSVDYCHYIFSQNVFKDLIPTNAIDRLSGSQFTTVNNGNAETINVFNIQEMNGDISV